MKKKLKVIDLFAGCGGLSDGFEQTGLYETLACVEWAVEPCNTLKKRLKDKWGYESDHIVLNFDIQRTDELLNGWNNDLKYGSHPGLNSILGAGKEVDIIIGGPPCQAYSIAGRIRDENGMNDDYRNYLFESYLKVVDHYKPKAFLFENVPGMLSAKPGGISIIQRISDAFQKSGYSIVDNLKACAIVDCDDYGVPQARRRLIILGIRPDSIHSDPTDALRDFYQNILPRYKEDRKRTVKDAIGSLPKKFPLKSQIKVKERKYSHTYDKGEIANHEVRLHNSRDINTFKMLAADIQTGENKYSSIESLKTLYFELTGRDSNIHKYHVLKWDKPSNTIPAHLYKDGLRHIHPDPEQARTITVREAARLQSFDDDYFFTGSLTEQFKMVGNAVPPKLSKAIALALSEFAGKYY